MTSPFLCTAIANPSLPLRWSALSSLQSLPHIIALALEASNVRNSGSAQGTHPTNLATSTILLKFAPIEAGRRFV